MSWPDSNLIRLPLARALNARSLLYDRELDMRQYGSSCSEGKVPIAGSYPESVSCVDASTAKGPGLNKAAIVGLIITAVVLVVVVPICIIISNRYFKHRRSVDAAKREEEPNDPILRSLPILSKDAEWVQQDVEKFGTKNEENERNDRANRWLSKLWKR